MTTPVNVSVPELFAAADHGTGAVIAYLDAAGLGAGNPDFETLSVLALDAAQARRRIREGAAELRRTADRFDRLVTDATQDTGDARNSGTSYLAAVQAVGTHDLLTVQAKRILDRYA